MGRLLHIFYDNRVIEKCEFSEERQKKTHNKWKMASWNLNQLRIEGPNGRMTRVTGSQGRVTNCEILRFATLRLFSMLSLPSLDSMCQSLQVH